MASESWVNIGLRNGLLPDGSNRYIAVCTVILHLRQGYAWRTINVYVANLSKQ